VENLERAYKRREGEPIGMDIDNMFTGEEGYGQFLDLTRPHEDYLNLPGVKRLTYVQYLEVFDAFTPPQLLIKRPNKLSDKYFQYVGHLAAYLEEFMKKTRPLQDLGKLFASYDEEFEKQWAANEVPGWSEETAQNGPQGPNTEGSGEGIWCADCEKEFKNENVYKNHLTGKKHIRAAEAKKAAGDSGEKPASAKGASSVTSRLKERAVAEREYRVRSLAQALDAERQATRINVERRQGMTERERQMELEALLAESGNTGGDRGGDQSDDDDEDRIYNPLKLPLAWDGKPIPYWLYKLHGLGVEYPCEVCGNFVYMGRRAFDKHFSEALHIFGLKCLGITSNTNLFREITKIDDAIRLWEKLEHDRKKDKDSRDNVVQMEDAEGNVMPERIYLEYVFPKFVHCQKFRNLLTFYQSSKARHPVAAASPLCITYPHISTYLTFKSLEFDGSFLHFRRVSYYWVVRLGIITTSVHGLMRLMYFKNLQSTTRLDYLTVFPLESVSLKLLRPTIILSFLCERSRAFAIHGRDPA
jgi:hypothetical protein